MAIRNVVQRGYNAGASIAFVTTRGYNIGGEAPVFIGPDIADRIWIVDVPIPTIAIADLFAGSVDDYSNTGATLPTGVGLNTSTGLISGTPTVIATTTGLIQSANVTGPPPGSTPTNTWQADVVAVDLTAGTLDDVMYFQLGAAGFTQESLNQRLVAWFISLGHTGGLGDLWLQFLFDAGFTAGDLDDRKLDYYISLGADADSGLGDAELFIWLNSPPT